MTDEHCSITRFSIENENAKPPRKVLLSLVGTVPLSWTFGTRHSAAWRRVTDGRPDPNPTWPIIAPISSPKPKQSGCTCNRHMHIPPSTPQEETRFAPLAFVSIVVVAVIKRAAPCAVRLITSLPHKPSYPPPHPTCLFFSSLLFSQQPQRHNPAALPPALPSEPALV
jgi:hypothetical protein